MKTLWKIACQEDVYPGMWQRWFKNQCVAVGWASGIKRIHDECVAAGVRVEFKRVKTGFVVAFYRPKWEEGEGLEKGGLKTNQKTNQKILNLIRQNSKITTEQLAQVTGLSIAGVKYNLNKLKKENVLKRIGPDKGGHWEVF